MNTLDQARKPGNTIPAINRIRLKPVRVIGWQVNRNLTVEAVEVRHGG